MIKKEKKTKKAYLKEGILITLRYLILLALMFFLPLIYKIFTPPTIYLSAGLLKLAFYQVGINQNIIILNSQTFIQIIPACVAGSAYLLLLILNLAVPMKAKKRIYSIILSFLFLLTLNVLRIFLFSALFERKFLLFDFVHKLFWYVLSTIFVIGIWFLIVKMFSIKEIPIYSDMKTLVKRMRK